MSITVCLKAADTVVLGTDSRFMTPDLTAIYSDSIPKVYPVGTIGFIACNGYRLACDYQQTRASEIALELGTRDIETIAEALARESMPVMQQLVASLHAAISSAPGRYARMCEVGQLQRAWRECGVRLFPELFGKRCAGVGSDRRHSEPSGYAAAYDPRLGDAGHWRQLGRDLWRGDWRGATHSERDRDVLRDGHVHQHGRRERGDWRRASSRHWRRNLYNDWKRRRTSASVPCRLWKCYGHNFWGQFFGVFQRLRQQFESGYPASERPVFQLATSCQSKADRAGHAIVYHVRASSDMGLEPPDRPSEPRARNLGERK